MHVTRKKRDVLEVLKLELEFLKERRLPQGVFMAPSIYLRGFSDLLELWRSRTKENLLRMCPDVSGAGGISRR